MATELRTGGAVTDAVDVRTGFRDFRLEGGRFVLNGAPIALRGVGKHQETEYSQAAMSDEEIREDFANLRDLGVNSVRLAHYPHAALDYDLADEMGLLVWAENGHSNVNKTTDTGDRITREMVRQNYNHPSIVIWSVGNETGVRARQPLRGRGARRGPEPPHHLRQQHRRQGEEALSRPRLHRPQHLPRLVPRGAVGVRAEGARDGLHLRERRRAP